MKLLKEIDPKLYALGVDECAEPIDIQIDTAVEAGSVLYVARFWTPQQLALEGLVTVHSLENDCIDFQQANIEGELVGMPYRATIDDTGVIGPVTLTDRQVVRTEEGYLVQLGDAMDDELTAMIAEAQPITVNATLAAQGSELS
jgi:hypothetical protein